MDSYALPPLHAGAGFPTGWLHSDWHFDPTVVIGTVAISILYLLVTGPLNRRRPGAETRPVTTRQRVFFLSGSLLLLVALGQPLDDWSDNYLLSAHMLQHMLIMFGVAPLWLAGTPGWIYNPLTSRPVTRRIGYVLTRPVTALVISNALIIAWHLPVLYDKALGNEPIHIVQHLSFLVAAMIGWWPVVGTAEAWPKPQPLVQCLYLFLYSLPSSILGAFLSLGAAGIYPYYNDVPRIGGISLEQDQQLAGVMMWVGGGTLFLLWITGIFFTWAASEERADEAASRSPKPQA